MMPSIVKTVMKLGSSNRAQSPPVDLCEICGKKPKYVEKGYKHPYCSRTCARNSQAVNPASCILPGCRTTGKAAFGNFCSESHAKDGVKQGIADACDSCRELPRTIGELCIACDRHARHNPRLRELDVDGTSFKNVRAQFLSEWETRGSTPKVEKVYEVLLPRDIRARHDAYRTKQHNMTEIRTFHSSQCICDLGFRDSALCNFRSCGICCIVKSAFKAFAFGVPFNNGRFGDGIYSYRNPGLADKFATSCTSSPYRVMIACDATVEKPDSSANDEEMEKESLFVPVADAILPVYVVMYTK